MIKVMPGTAGSYHNFKCGEVYCLSAEEYKINCCLCDLEVDFEDFRKHLQEQHLDLICTDDKKNSRGGGKGSSISINKAVDKLPEETRARTRSSTAKLNIKTEVDNDDDDKEYRECVNDTEDVTSHSWADHFQDDDEIPIDMAAVESGKRASSESIINYGRSANSRIPDRQSDVEEDDEETKKSKRPISKWRQFFDVIICPETNEKRFKCNKCGTVIRDASNVHHHINRVHEKLRPHKCDECKREFHSRSELIIHKRKHTGERPYLCVECGVAFISASDLHRHRLQNHVVHVRDKKCSICGKAFLQKKILQRHVRSVHSEERPFECNVCGACFKLRSTLRTHMRIHEDKRQYKCNLCDASYNYKSILDSHMKRKHYLANEKTI